MPCLREKCSLKDPRGSYPRPQTLAGFLAKNESILSMIFAQRKAPKKSVRQLFVSLICAISLLSFLFL